MKKTDKTALTAAMFAAALNLIPTSSGTVLAADTGETSAETAAVAEYDPAEEPLQEVYGPPVLFETTEPESLMTTATQPVVEPVYGPPWAFTTQTQTSVETTATTAASTTYDPSAEIEQPVYGPPALGDINWDGRVDAFDLIAARQAYISGTKVIYQEYAADVNGDGQFTVADIVMLSQYLLGQIDNFENTPAETQTTAQTTDQSLNTVTAPVTSVIDPYIEPVYGPPWWYENE